MQFAGRAALSIFRYDDVISKQSWNMMHSQGKFSELMVQLLRIKNNNKILLCLIT